MATRWKCRGSWEWREMTTFDLADAGLLFREDVLADPKPFYEFLRTHAPVWELPGSSTFMVTSAALVAEAVTRIDDFSSNLSSLIFRGDDGCPVVFDLTPLGDATHVLATADPPIHGPHRKLLQSNLTPKHADRLESEITAMVDDLIAPLLAAGGGDLVPTFADRLPMKVITRVIGLPQEDADMLIELVLEVEPLLSGVSDEESTIRGAAAAARESQYLAANLERKMERPVDPEDDSLLAVAAGSVSRGEVTFDEAVGILVQLLGAGSETTSSLIASAIRRIAEDASLQDDLRADPQQVVAFLEETLRLDSPFQFHYRSTPRATSLGGVEIPAGSRVLLMWAAANLDHNAFTEADCMRLDRPSLKGHLAFGRGLHFCIGAPLARLETRIAIERILATTTKVGLDSANPPRHHRNIFLRRHAELSIRLTAQDARR